MRNNIYTTFEISRSLSVDITTVMSWIDQRKLAAYKTPGGHRRVLKEDLLSFLKKYRIPVPADLQKKSDRILIVDDDPQVVKLLSRLLKKINSKFKVETSQDGFEAGRKLENFNPDLVILDLKLPGVDGFRVCKNIRTDKNKKDVKILAISGDNTPNNKKKILKCGANEFMGKPLQIEEFTDSLGKLLSLS